jgi:23S rRNA pseudouridine2605 synthase
MVIATANTPSLKPSIRLLSIPASRSAPARSVAGGHAGQIRLADRAGQHLGDVDDLQALLGLTGALLGRDRVAIEAILAGRVRVSGRVVTDPGVAVAPERATITLDDEPVERAEWRTIVLNKPRGVVTTRKDPQGRRTIYDVVGDLDGWLAPVGRLDAATSGLLLLTNDTPLAAWLMDPSNGVVRVYRVTVRGRVTDDDRERLERGVVDRGETLKANEATIRKASGRETHLIVRLTEGKNREIRRLFRAVGHDVTALARVAIGGLELAGLAAGAWREVSRGEIRSAFPAAPLRST